MIPIYRAKSKDTGEWVEGHYAPANNRHYLIQKLSVSKETNTVRWTSTDLIEIDPSTLAIHFPNMLDKNGEKIWASLNGSGVGGSIVISDEYPFFGGNNYDAIVMMVFNQPQYIYRRISDRVSGASEGVNNSFDDEYNNFKTIGIYEGENNGN